MARIIVNAQLAYRTAEEGLSLIPLLLEAGIWFLEAVVARRYPRPRRPRHRSRRRRSPPHPRPRVHRDDGPWWRRYLSAQHQPGGGFTGILKIAATAADRHKRVVTNGYKTNVEIAANFHFLAAHPEEKLLEYSLSSSPLRWETTLERFPIKSDRCVRVPEAPGIGVTLDPCIVGKYRWPPQQP